MPTSSTRAANSGPRSLSVQQESGHIHVHVTYMPEV
eukprot:CAMPEP_0179868874 /NCGR_PEP_ID=MMETSP0982-20121206/19144_1 /TAXON_ID=483367 /ORGANISM="non described non described, Strain CCMP 2436" /LENGTH=35 /DNA_ID= /DNA_START= /DNA_END= /DNA_ORIENTATION=